MKSGFIRKHWAEIGIGGGLVIAAAGIAVPGYMNARSVDRMRKCQENLTKIEGAIEQWALENNRSPGDHPGRADIVNEGRPGYLREFPVCPSGASYVIRPVGETPTCLSGLSGHELIHNLCNATTEIETP